MIEPFNRVSVEETYPNIIKVISDKPMVKIILNCEKLKAFSLRSGKRQEWPLLFKVAMEVLPGVVRQEKERKTFKLE